MLGLVLSACALGPAAPTGIEPLLRRGEDRAACTQLGDSELDREEIDAQREMLTAAVAWHSEARVSFHALDAAEVGRLLGVPVRANSGYLEDLLLVRATLDARRSRVPAQLQLFVRDWEGEDGRWRIPEDKELDAVHLALLGARRPPIEHPTPTPRSYGFFEYFFLNFFTGGVVLAGDILERFRGSPGYPAPTVAPALRERDQLGQRPPYAPYRPAPPSAVRAVHDLIALEAPCSADAGGTCNTYRLYRREARKGQPKPGTVQGEVTFLVEPDCRLEVSSEPGLPSGPTLFQRLRKLEAAGPTDVLAPPPRPRAPRKDQE